MGFTTGERWDDGRPLPDVLLPLLFCNCAAEEGGGVIEEASSGLGSAAPEGEAEAGGGPAEGEEDWWIFEDDEGRFVDWATASRMRLRHSANSFFRSSCIISVRAAK